MPEEKFVSKASSKKMRYKSKKRTRIAAIFVSAASVAALAVLLVIAGVKNIPDSPEETVVDSTPEISEQTLEEYAAIPENLVEEQDQIPVKENMFYIEESGVSREFVNLICAMYKNEYDAFAGAEDGAWDNVISVDGSTISRTLSEKVLETVKKYLASEHLHDKVFFLELSDEASGEITRKMNEYTSLAGSEEALKELLLLCNTDVYELNRYLFFEAKYNNLREYFYGDSGIYKITDEAKKNVFASEYSIVTHIFFDTVSKTDENGVTTALTPEEITAKRAFAKEVFSGIKTDIC